MTWANYIEDIDIPEHWVDVSYGNDALPSYMSEDDDYKAYNIWMDSHDLEERKANAKDIYGVTNPLPPRFHVVLCYGHNDVFFASDDFADVVQWITDNPKSSAQIEETKEYI